MKKPIVILTEETLIIAGDPVSPKIRKEFSFLEDRKDVTSINIKALVELLKIHGVFDKINN